MRVLYFHVALYNQGMKITTKKGDMGETGLFDGTRVSKGDVLMDALGDLDELQAVIGWCRCAEGIEDAIAAGLERVEDCLYEAMASVSGAGEKLNEEKVEFLEGEIEKHEKDGALREFVRPGKNEISSRLHIARTVCRRAERSCVKAEIGGIVVKYLNRLSDLLFILAEA